MIALGQFETAAAQMQSLAENDRTKKLLDSNEAENRLLLIDDVLEILGWHRDEFKPEQATLSGDYTDYRLTIDGNERLIVEAKRMGVLNSLPNTIKQREYQNGTLYKNCGVEIQQILDQCLRYCRETGIPYALATNGNIWIVFMGFKKDIPWRQLKSFVFHSLQDVCARFSEFYGLVSREAVQDNGLEEKFVSALRVCKCITFQAAASAPATRGRRV